MPGLVVSIGGKLDASLKNALNQAQAMSLAEINKLAREQERLQQNLFRAQQSRSPGAIFDVSQQIEKNRIATNAATRAHLEERAAIESKWQVFKKRQAEAFSAVGQTAFAPTHINKLFEKEGGSFQQAGKTAGASFASGFRFQFLNAAASGGGGILAGMGSSGMSQLISVASNTASSLGSGMNPMRVFMQQAPNVAQAFTLMGSKIPFFNKLIKDTRLASEKLAESLAEQALKSAAVAQMDILAYEKEVALTGATSAGALAAQAKAAASTEAALADEARAISAAKAATAERALAGAPKLAIGPLGIVAGIITGIAIGALAAWKHSSVLIDKLSGFKPPDFKPEYIEKHLQKANQALEVQKDITHEIEKQKMLYNSASAAAERAAAATKSHFEHLRQMNQLSNKPDFMKVREEARINAEERAAELQNKRDEQAALEKEGREKQAEASRILTGVNSKEHDQNLISSAKAKMDAAQQALDDLNKSKDKNNPAGISSDQVFRAYNAATASNVSGKDLDAAEKQIRADARTYEQAYRAAKDQAADNDVIRSKGDEFAKAAAESMGKAENIKAALPDLEKQAAQKNTDEQEIAAAKLRNPGGGQGNGFVTERERIGLGAASSVQTSILETAKRSLAVQQDLLKSNQTLAKQIYDAGGF